MIEKSTLAAVIAAGLVLSAAASPILTTRPTARSAAV